MSLLILLHLPVRAMRLAEYDPGLLGDLGALKVRYNTVSTHTLFCAFNVIAHVLIELDLD